MKVAVHGSYFVYNFGDTLLVKSLCDYIAKIVGDDNVFLATEGNSDEQEDIGYPVCPPEQSDSITHLIFAGGGYFGEPAHDPQGLAHWAQRCYARHLRWIGRYSNAKIGIFGVGFGPISDGRLREDILDLMQRSEVNLLRDPESLNFLKDYSKGEIDAEVCVDYALKPFAVKDHFQNLKPNIRRLALHVPSIPTSQLVSLVEAVEELYSDTLECVTVVHDSRGRGFLNCIKDAFKRARLAKLFSNKTLVINSLRLSRLASFYDRLVKHDLVITSKLHVGIVCISNGVYAVSIARHPKVTRLYSQLSISEYHVPLQNDLNSLGIALSSLHLYRPDHLIVKERIAGFEKRLEQFLCHNKTLLRQHE